MTHDGLMETRFANFVREVRIDMCRQIVHGLKWSSPSSTHVLVKSKVVD